MQPGVTLALPEVRDALNAGLIEELVEDDKVRMVVPAGEGDYFRAGGERRVVRAGHGRLLLRRGYRDLTGDNSLVRAAHRGAAPGEATEVMARRIAELRTGEEGLGVSLEKREPGRAES